MHRAKLSTVELAYVDHGIGPPILLVHGFPLDHSMWSAQIDALAGRYRVIAPDLRGFGESSLGDADPEVGVSMERYADDLAELLDVLAVADPVVLVGFSMGGYIAWQFVRKHAVRLRALIQCDTRAAADSDDLAVVARAAASGAGEALSHTPEQLPVLARAGVVDAGGQGLVVLLESLVEVVTGQPPQRPVSAAQARIQLSGWCRSLGEVHITNAHAATMTITTGVWCAVTTTDRADSRSTRSSGS